MSLYAIGDLQGCHTEFCELLERIDFAPARDRLWLVGDLVNRGPGSLAVLREVKALGNAAVTVLGNHDLHLLTVARGHRRLHRSDTVGDILAAPDRDDLLDWLQTRPLMVMEDDRILVHAGVLPQWRAAEAVARAGEVAAVLAGDEANAFLATMYGDTPHAWRDDLEGVDRLRVIVNVCTRLRFCSANGAMEFKEKRGREHAPDGTLAWFDHPYRGWAGTHIVCGHWSTLGLTLEPDVSMLDTGCVWGGPLTAMRLPDRRVDQVPSHQEAPTQPGE
ncbi:MAG: symmetrical bis(5'-nucleosyl)-tetraphosphatase [Casimicrobiaceae bacterium]